VEKLLETWAISVEQPSTAPAVETMSSELFEFVFPGGVPERSVTMVNEFSKMFVSALATARDRGPHTRGNTTSDVFNSVLNRRRQIWRD
jgi:hypothetical protein